MIAVGAPQNASDFPIVGIGSSAGGLEACRKFLEPLPAHNGLALILVQHLDPTHESMLVELLGGHKSISVLQATDGMRIEPEHLYIIPPGKYLSVDDDILHLSEPQAPHGARMPFDFLLSSLAEAYGARAACVILSGTGADGTLGLEKIKEKNGFVIVQDPDEAGFDGMPRSAMKTGKVDLVLPVAKIPQALIQHFNETISVKNDDSSASLAQDDWLSKIIDYLRQNTPHDFRLYKKGTLQRRIERRMAMVGIKIDLMAHYFDLLQSDVTERNLLAKDVLINVTGFFRDRQVFDYLEMKIIPDLVGSQGQNESIRIWIAGCSTGEETYSLSMLFCEAIKATKAKAKLQVFASDVDPDAVAFAREGLYPATIEENVSQERLSHFFSREENGYRISPELRACIVFTVQDVLSDPPFSRLDMVSCRNLLIYLNLEAQAKVVSLFHFALREGGVLLLGNAETIGNADSRFEVISKTQRLYRHVGRSRPGDLRFTLNPNDSLQPAARIGQKGVSRQSSFSELCKRYIIESFAPATVLIDHKLECLYFVGPTDRYLRLAAGTPTNNIILMARQGVRAKLNSAIEQSRKNNIHVLVSGVKVDHDGVSYCFNIAVQPVLHDSQNLLLIFFIDEPQKDLGVEQISSPEDLPRIEALERELEATTAELQGAIRDLEISGEEQKTIADEALSVSEEFQSTNEELLTSKEELQSLNEELTALNNQLQETLERQRITANDLQNVLYSTNVATLFLDVHLNIRFFTPATKSLFNVILSDVGRPLADLSSLAVDGALLDDARAVLEGSARIDLEIQTKENTWFIRRIMPYRTQEKGIEGVVITFIENTERKHVADALEEAKQLAELATIAKSRFVATASHDLRQPLQTLGLLQSLLMDSVKDEKAKELLERFDDTLGTMSAMLNTLLDINQIEAGAVRVNKVTFSLNELFDRFRNEFAFHAKAQGLKLSVVECSCLIHTDPRLLEQMIRNLLSNALKYTKSGKLLLGCRRHGDLLRIEVWDTGIGIPQTELQTIFNEYHQVGAEARQRGFGLGLGLSIVRRLGDILDHAVQVRSQLDRGSVFSIEIKNPPGVALQIESPDEVADDMSPEWDYHPSTILVIEDDAEMCALFEELLRKDGYRVIASSNGNAAMQSVTKMAIHPDLILADFNLPIGMNGTQVATKLREQLRQETPVIILTGNISIETLRDIKRHDFVQLNKPVKFVELKRVIERLLSKPKSSAASPTLLQLPPGNTSASAVIFVVDDDIGVSESIRDVLETQGLSVETFLSCESFLETYRPRRDACLVVDAYLPGMSGLDLLRRLRRSGDLVPTIVVTGHSDVAIAIEAMKAGAHDFLEKPFSRADLLTSLNLIFEREKDAGKHSAWQNDAKERLATLTQRQREIVTMILEGRPNKNIAKDLGISQRTVENHRAAIMKKTGSKSLPALARLALAAGEIDDDKIA